MSIMCPVSALKGTGIEQLLEMILLQAEMLELKAEPDGGAARHGHRGADRAGARPDGDGDHPHGHAEGRPGVHLRQFQRQGEVADRRQGPADQGGAALDAGAKCWDSPGCRTPATSCW